MLISLELCYQCGNHNHIVMSRAAVDIEDLGTIFKDKILSLDSSIRENATRAFIFTVEDEDGFFAEITINNLQDDLDLTLSRIDLESKSVLDIGESSYSGTEEEYIGKFLQAGIYRIDVDYFDALSAPSYNPFSLSVDTKSFYESTVLPNDPLFDKQWHLFNTGQGDGIDNEDILAPEAWKIRSTSPDVTVAVIDGAIDLTHEDLINNLWVNTGEIPNNNNDDEFGFWPMVIGGFFLYASYYGTDQTQSQRLLSSKNMGTIKKLLFANALFRFPITLTYCIMGLILGTLFFQDIGFQNSLNEVYSNNIASLEGKKADLMVPVFITNYLPNGMIGVLIVAIMSAAMSSLSSTINSLSAVTMEDFVKRFNPTISDKRYVLNSRIFSLFWGSVCLFFAFLTGNIEGTVIEVINKIGSVFYGPMLGAFILAIMTKKTHALGANIGIVSGVILNIYLWLYVPSIFWFWWNAIGCFITVSIGILSSKLIKKKITESLELSYYAGKKDIVLLFLYFSFIVGLSIYLPNLFSG